MPEITIVGDAVIDQFITLPEGNIDTFCDIKSRSKKIILPYGEKIEIENIEKHCGGNAVNIAVGLKSLGIDILPVIPIGVDTFSNIAYTELIKGGVEIKPPYLNSSIRINSSYILRYQGERTILSFHEPKEYILPEMLSTKYLYFSSHSGNNTTLSIKILRLLESSKAKLIFAPSNVQIYGDKNILQTLIQNSCLLICNTTEASEIVKTLDTTVTSIQEVVETLHHLGPEYVVVSDGSNGVYYRDKVEVKHLPAPYIKPEEFIDVTGAGDALTTGVISCLIKGKSIEEGLDIGQSLSAQVIKYIGSITAFLKMSDKT